MLLFFVVIQHTLHFYSLPYWFALRHIHCHTVLYYTKTSPSFEAWGYHKQYKPLKSERLIFLLCRVFTSPCLLLPLQVADLTCPVKWPWLIGVWSLSLPPTYIWKLSTQVWNMFGWRRSHFRHYLLLCPSRPIKFSADMFIVSKSCWWVVFGCHFTRNRLMTNSVIFYCCVKIKHHILNTVFLGRRIVLNSWRPLTQMNLLSVFICSALNFIFRMPLVVICVYFFFECHLKWSFSSQSLQ